MNCWTASPAELADAQAALSTNECRRSVWVYLARPGVTPRIHKARLAGAAAARPVIPETGQIGKREEFNSKLERSKCAWLGSG